MMMENNNLNSKPNTNTNISDKIEKEAVFGIVPITRSKRQYGF